MKVFLYPEFSGEDKGDGGIRRVVEAQRKSLPRLRIQFVDNPGDANLIACHTVIPEQYIRQFPDKPIVNHTHGLYWQQYQWMDWSYKANKDVLRAICTADVTTAPTEWVAQIVRRHTSRDVRVIPHGVSVSVSDGWQPPSQHQNYVLWNKTRVDPVCEVDSLNALVRKMPDVQFKSTFGDDAPNIEITGRLPFVKAKQDVRHAGVYLVTVRETFGIGTLEAMACEVPVVGFNFGGQAEFIEHGVDGWLAEPGDIDGLAEGVRWAFENREAVGKAAREKVASQFSWATVAQKYADLYKEVYERYEEQETTPRVSIIVPAYNLAEYLPATLDSIKNQADTNWECLVVDDASPDNCGAIAEEYASKDKRFRVIHNEKNLYLAESRNVAIQKARGRYILPVDADDMLTPHAVRMLADSLDADRSLQVAYGNVFFTEEDGKTPVNYRVPSQAPGHSGWPMPADPWRQVGGANLLPYSSMFRKSAWQQVGGYRRRLKTSEDADFWTRLASYGFKMQFVATADTLIYRNREGSMSRANGERRHDYLRWYPWSKERVLAPAGLAGEKAVSMLTPHVSVVIPVGPAHTTLVQDAIDSVQAQSYPNWECIVVNDSGKNLLLPTWVREIKCKARDVAAARNLGISNALGKLYLPLDADDFLQPDALLWLVTAYVESGGDIVYPDFFEDPKQEGQFKPFGLPDWSCSVLASRKMPHSVTALTPVAVWKKVGGYQEGLQWEDWDFQLKCAAMGFCTRRLAAPLFTYRKWTGTRRNWKDREEFGQRLQAIIDRWQEYFEGSKEFMACGCKGKTVKPSASPNGGGGASSAMAGSDAVMVRYTGQRSGSVRYKGVGTGMIYTFAANESAKWVAAKDLSTFEVLKDFSIVADASPIASSGPVLVA